MANEATVFSILTADQTGAHGGADVEVATTNAAAVPSDIILGVYFLKADYDGDEGRSKLIRDLQQILAKINSQAWPFA